MTRIFSLTTFAVINKIFIKNFLVSVLCFSNISYSTPFTEKVKSYHLPDFVEPIALYSSSFQIIKKRHLVYTKAIIAKDQIISNSLFSIEVKKNDIIKFKGKHYDFNKKLGGLHFFKPKIIKFKRGIKLKDSRIIISSRDYYYSDQSHRVLEIGYLREKHEVSDQKRNQFFVPRELLDDRFFSKSFSCNFYDDYDYRSSKGLQLIPDNGFPHSLKHVYPDNCPKLNSNFIIKHNDIVYPRKKEDWFGLWYVFKKGEYPRFNFSGGGFSAEFSYDYRNNKRSRTLDYGFNQIQNLSSFKYKREYFTSLKKFPSCRFTLELDEATQSLPERLILPSYWKKKKCDLQDLPTVSLHHDDKKVLKCLKSEECRITSDLYFTDSHDLSRLRATAYLEEEVPRFKGRKILFRNLKSSFIKNSCVAKLGKGAEGDGWVDSLRSKELDLGTREEFYDTSTKKFVIRKSGEKVKVLSRYLCYAKNLRLRFF